MNDLQYITIMICSGILIAFIPIEFDRLEFAIKRNKKLEGIIENQLKVIDKIFNQSKVNNNFVSITFKCDCGSTEFRAWNGILNCNNPICKRQIMNLEELNDFYGNIFDEIEIILIPKH